MMIAGMPVMVVTGFYTTRGLGGPKPDPYHAAPPPVLVTEVRTKYSVEIGRGSSANLSIRATTQAIAWSIAQEGLKKSDARSWVQIVDRTSYPAGGIAGKDPRTPAPRTAEWSRLHALEVGFRKLALLPSSGAELALASFRP